MDVLSMRKITLCHAQMPPKSIENAYLIIDKIYNKFNLYPLSLLWLIYEISILDYRTHLHHSIAVQLRRNDKNYLLTFKLVRNGKSVK